jgi:hypothetical protein
MAGREHGIRTQEDYRRANDMMQDVGSELTILASAEPTLQDTMAELGCGWAGEKIRST